MQLRANGYIVPWYRLQFANNGDLFIEMLKTQRSVCVVYYGTRQFLSYTMPRKRSFKTYQSVHNGFRADIDAC